MNSFNIKKRYWVFYALFIVFLAFLSVQNVSAQDIGSEKVTISVKAQSLEKTFKEISSQTDVKFFYNEAIAKSGKTVSLQFRNEKLSAVLDEIKKQTGLHFTRENNTISVSDHKENNQYLLTYKGTPKKVSGTIVDDYGEPITGVSVVIQGTTNGTMTDIDGNYSIEAPEDATLVISYIGFVSQNITIGKNNTIDVRLSENARILDEVVVVGYGVQKKVNLTGAISTLDAKVLENRPITNSTQALQGVQGIYVNQPGGQPGKDGATIRIRGQGTLNNNDPLILVNGIEFPLDAINPNDIESISVLKDAASSAIYGSRAANGVILVTTKSGKKAGGFTVEYNNYFGAQRATYLPKMVYDPIVFMEQRNIAQKNEGKLVLDYAPEMIEEYKTGMQTDPYTYPCNNWMDIMYNDAFIMEHNLRFSGGDEKYTYSLSLGYNEQDGVLRGTDATKYTMAFDATAKVSSRLTVGSSINMNYNIFNEPAAGVGNLVEMTYKAQAFYPTYMADGRYANTFIRTPGHNVYRHPLALADEGDNQTKKQQILINLSAEYKLPFNLIYKLNVGLNKFDYLNSIFIPDVYHYQVKTEEKLRIDFNGKPRQAKKIDENNLNTTVFNTLGWEQKFNEMHNVKALLGGSYENFYDSNFNAQREGFLGNTLTELDAGSNNPVVGGTSKKSVLMSMFGRVNYDLKDRYLFEANFRYDGSSRFAKGHRWGLFPSFSAGWRISEEGFLKEANWLQNLKIRASWGQLGNERIDLFRYVDLMQLGQNYPFNGSVSSGAAVNAYSDPDITWETTTMTNVGIDASFFKGTLDFSAELFNKRTSDILRAVSLPDQVGSLAGPIRNIGTVDNKGIELSLGYRNNIREFKYEITGNMTLLKNKIVDLKGQTIINGMFILKEGESIDSYYMLNAIGIFQSQEEIDNSPTQTANTKPGYLKFEDVDKDGVITENDRKIVGNVIPTITYSFGVNLSYKNFDLNAFFQGIGNVNTYGDGIAATPFWFGCGLPEEWLTDAWTPERGASARLPILTTYEGSTAENYRTNSFWLRDASYLRLKNLQLIYNVPVPFLNKKAPMIKRLRIFANASNLFTLSSMKQFDPEKNVKNSNWYEYPSVKTFSGGINITF